MISERAKECVGFAPSNLPAVPRIVTCKNLEKFSGNSSMPHSLGGIPCRHAIKDGRKQVALELPDDPRMRTQRRPQRLGPENFPVPRLAEADVGSNRISRTDPCPSGESEGVVRDVVGWMEHENEEVRTELFANLVEE